MPDNEDFQQLSDPMWWAVYYNPPGVPSSVRAISVPEDAIPPEVAVEGERPRLPIEPL